MLIGVDEALDRILKGVTLLGRERVGVGAAADRVLAEDLIAAQPMPPFSQSAMDGYAVRASFFAGPGPWTLEVRGESRAGCAGPPVGHGQAGRIFTGAPVPHGANAVVLQEDVTRSGETIRVTERPREGQNIRSEGADMARGSLALAAGLRLHPGRLGLCAALDRAYVVVARRPIVTIVSTGDELRPAGVAGSETSIPESNSPVLAAIAERVGAIARVSPLLADDAEHTEAELRRALRGSDLVVTIGGASVGDHDLVRPALQAIGVAIDFWGVAMKPGKPTGFGSHGGTKVLCVPGNPASAALAFLLFGVPALRAMQGEKAVRPRRPPLRIIGSHGRRPGREEYLRARLELHDGELCAALMPNQSSGAVPSFAQADALVVLAAHRASIANGDRLPVIPLADVWSP
jgi:molybdopterin molybdotransferase